MKHMAVFFLALIAFGVHSCFAIAIYASDFNQTVSCGNPLILDESSLLFLDQDIIIDQNCPLFQLAASFLTTDSLLIYSRQGFSIIITVDCDFGTVFFEGHQIVLQGNAQLVIMPGISITGQNTALFCTQNSRIKWL